MQRMCWNNKESQLIRPLSLKPPWNKPTKLKLNTKELDKPLYLKLYRGKQKRKPLELRLKK